MDLLCVEHSGRRHHLPVWEVAREKFALDHTGLSLPFILCLVLLLSRSPSLLYPACRRHTHGYAYAYAWMLLGCLPLTLVWMFTTIQ